MIIKKYLPVCTALLLAAVLLLSTFSAMAAGDPNVGEGETFSQQIVDRTEETTPTEPEYKPGDVNGDNVVDINDVTTLQSVFVGLAKKTAVFEKNGDTNTDGKINIWDATVIQLYNAGVFKMLPVTTDGYYSHIFRP